MANGAALPAPNPLDRILSAHPKAFTYLIQGAAGFGQGVYFTQYTDAADYANKMGNVDSTNGLALKIQYGPAASPSTIATFSKAACTFVSPVSFSGPLVPGSYVDLAPIATPAAPSTGIRFYARSDGLLRYIPAAGAEHALVDTDTVQTLTNKTLTSPVLTTPTISTLTTNADLLYGTGSGVLARLGIGTSFQSLITGNGATAPVWADGCNAVLTTIGDLLTASAANTPARLARGTKGYALLAGATLPIYDTIDRKNRIVNGSFRVNQHSTLGSTDDTYILDRWNLLLEAANAATVLQETSDVPTDGAKYGIRFTVGSGNNNKFGMVQLLEWNDCGDLRGKTVSLQFKMKSTAGIVNARAAVIEWSSAVDVVTSDVVGTWGADGTNPTLATNWTYDNTPANLSPTTSWATYKIENITLGSAFNNLAVFIWSDDRTTTQTTDILRVTDVQLEEGTVCTQVERRPVMTELDLCRWWYEEQGGEEASSAETFGAGFSFSTTQYLATMYYRAPKRIVPTITHTASANYAFTNGAAAGVTCNAGPTNNHQTTRNVSLTGSVAAGLTLGQGGVLIANSTTAAITKVSAEL